MLRNIIAGSCLALALAGGAVACSTNNSATQADQAATNNQLDRYQKNQPIPFNDSSVFRATLITVEQAQIHGIATTTFFYNQGVAKPDSCPSLGFPLPSTAQLTNPQQVINTYNNNAGVSIPQLEPNGVYTGDSTGTYVVCVDPTGAQYIQYWEGFVKTIGGPAHWDQGTQTIMLDGAPTVKPGK